MGNRPNVGLFKLFKSNFDMEECFSDSLEHADYWNSAC